MESIRIEKIYLDINGNKTDEAHAVDVVIRQYGEQGELLQTSVERVVQKKLGADASSGQGSYAGKPPAGQGSYAVPDAGERWICPNDETENTGDVCIICGLSRPVQEEEQKPGGKALWIAAAAAVFAVLILGVWYVGMDKPVAAPEQEPAQAVTEQDLTECWENNILMTQPIPYGEKENIRSVTFLDSCADAPADAWDVSETSDGSVLYWKRGNEVYLAGNGGINGQNACNRLFSGFESLEKVHFGDAFHTEYTTDMRYMFHGCIKLTSLDVGSLDTSNVTYTGSMFERCCSLTSLDVGGWDTSDVTDMNKMFAECYELTSLDVGSWDTSQVTNMGSMFFGCSTLSALDVSEWDTSKVTSMYDMFAISGLSTLDVSDWDTSNVTNMASMFQFCDKLSSLDVSHWDTSNVTNMREMFYSSNLPLIDVSGWDISAVQNYDDFMFCGMQINGRPWEEIFSASSSVPLELNVADIAVHQGYTCELELLNGLTATDVQWESSHPHIASITGDGVVKGEKVGTASITVTYGNQMEEVLVRVIS